MSRKIHWSDAPFSWPAEPELDEKALNSPQPCSHGSACRYDGPCAFVHKGEEGTGRRLFPARTTQDKDGKNVAQAACVRLIGSPGFYERRRLRLSWPEWCAKKGIQHGSGLGGQAGGSSQARAAQPAISAAPTATAWPALPYRPQRVAASLAQQQQPFPAAVAGISMEATYLFQQAIAQHGSIERAVEFQRQQLMLWQQSAAASAAKAQRNEYGEKLYAKLLPYCAEIQPLMGDNWPKGATAGKLVGMFLELDKEVWDEMLNDEAAFEEKVKEGLEVLDGVAKAEAAN